MVWDNAKEECVAPTPAPTPPPTPAPTPCKPAGAEVYYGQFSQCCSGSHETTRCTTANFRSVARDLMKPPGVLRPIFAVLLGIS